MKDEKHQGSESTYLSARHSHIDDGAASRRHLVSRHRSSHVQRCGALSTRSRPTAAVSHRKPKSAAGTDLTA